MNRFRIVSCLLLATLCACGGAEDEDAAVGASQAALRGAAPTSTSAAQTAAALATSGVIDGAKSAGENADAIAAALSSRCPSAMVSHQSGSVTVSVDFGAGCTVSGYGTVSGKLSLTVSQASGAVTAALTLSSLTVNQVQLNGTATVTSSDGKSYTLGLDLSAGGYQIVFAGTAVLDEDRRGVTLTGEGTLKGSGAAVPYRASAVHHLFGGCYADGGTLTVTETTVGKLGKAVTVTAVITFLPTTPSTGVVDVVVAGKSSQRTLPAYGACPKAA